MDVGVTLVLRSSLPMMSEENEDDDENQDELNNNNIYIREVSLLNSLQETSNTSLREDFLWLRQ